MSVIFYSIRHTFLAHLTITFACLFETLAHVFQNAVLFGLQYISLFIFQVFLLFHVLYCWTKTNIFLASFSTLLSYHCVLSAPYSSCRRNTESHHAINHYKPFPVPFVGDAVGIGIFWFTLWCKKLLVPFVLIYSLQIMLGDPF